MGTTPSDQRDAEAAALKAIYERKAAGIERKAFGKLHDIGSGSMMWQYLEGHRPLNLAAASRFARALDVPIDSFSQRLAAEAAEGYQHTMAARLAAAAPLANVSAVETREPVAVWGWPFRQIDADAVRALSAADLIRLEGAILGAASALQLDLGRRGAPT